MRDRVSLLAVFVGKVLDELQKLHRHDFPVSGVLKVFALR
jgi:hypothetical protein